MSHLNSSGFHLGETVLCDCSDTEAFVYVG